MSPITLTIYECDNDRWPRGPQGSVLLVLYAIYLETSTMMHEAPSSRGSIMFRALRGVTFRNVTR